MPVGNKTGKKKNNSVKDKQTAHALFSPAVSAAPQNSKNPENKSTNKKCDINKGKRLIQTGKQTLTGKIKIKVLNALQKICANRAVVPVAMDLGNIRHPRQHQHQCWKPVAHIKPDKRRQAENKSSKSKQNVPARRKNISNKAPSLATQSKKGSWCGKKIGKKHYLGPKRYAKNKKPGIKQKTFLSYMSLNTKRKPQPQTKHLKNHFTKKTMLNSLDIRKITAHKKDRKRSRPFTKPAPQNNPDA